MSGALRKGASAPRGPARLFNHPLWHSVGYQRLPPPLLQVSGSTHPLQRRVALSARRRSGSSTAPK
eukprot:5174928-Amphidinium_carterae.1